MAFNNLGKYMPTDYIKGRINKEIIKKVGDKNMKQTYKILISVFVILILISTSIATKPTPDPYEDCRSCHTTNVEGRHQYFSIIGKYACEDCHPFINNLMITEKDCKNCHNGTAFWANPDLNPGKPLHIPASITVASPKGDIWPRGTTQTIKWNYTGNPGPNVTIELLKGGLLNQNIVSSIIKGTGGSGYYNWAIPKSIEIGNDYQVKIRSMVSTTNNTYMNTSNDFTIQIK
ncbi:Ser-Thr-rich GPI-anchored membrane family protein [Candidatus Methanoperedens nitratireducens]|nr:Ser-Thr-rich GPI-anchored membrane family protein [Candidatus Methanoperedens nitroreducens]